MKATVVAGDVRRALATLGDLRHAVADRTWDVPAGQLEWTVAEVVDHLVDVAGYYTVHLATRRTTGVRVDVRPPHDVDNLGRVDAALAWG